jgi:hypothetical protein
MLHRIIVASCLLSLLACGDNKTPQPVHPPYEAGALPQLSCVPNLDGKIDATELTPALDNPVHYLVSPAGTTRAVSLAGSVDAQGHQTWDFGSDYADDQVATITATSIAGKWYASSFPGATFVAPFDAGDAVEAVYAYDTTAMTLLGLASHDPTGPGGKTLLVYAPPIALYKFPLAVGASYTSSGTITNGTLRGLPYAGTDTYDVSVDASGQLTLQAYTFTQVLRVRTTVTVAPSAGQSIVTRQTSFFFECFGEVARATSQPNETNDDFTTAAELRRLQ